MNQQEDYLRELLREIDRRRAAWSAAVGTPRHQRQWRKLNDAEEAYESFMEYLTR